MDISVGYPCTFIESFLISTFAMNAIGYLHMQAFVYICLWISRLRVDILIDWMSIGYPHILVDIQSAFGYPLQPQQVQTKTRGCIE